MKNDQVTEVKTETLIKLLEFSEAVLRGEYTHRIVTDFNDDIINQVINNFNKHVDRLMLNASEPTSEPVSITHFIETISSYANRDFNHKLPITEHGTILDAIATGINMLGDELQQSTASKEELELERNRLNEAQVLAKLGSWELDMATKTLRGSREMYRLFELENTPPAELYQAFRARYHPDDLPKMDDVIANPEAHADGFNYEHRIIRSNNSIAYFSCIGEVVNDETGKISGLKGTVQDITDRKNAEIELSNSFQVVTEQNKRLLNFSYIVSHNLRSHSSNITSLLKLIEAAETDEERQEIIEHMQTVSNLLNETMVNLHDIVSIQKNINLIVEPLNLHGYVNEAIAILSKQIEAKGALVENNVPKQTMVNYNPAYLESIVLNFLSNSIKYSSPDRKPVVKLDYCRENGHDVLQVQDNGVGIDLEKNGDKLFGMYKTFHGNKDARGIGLFISKNQIETMGGRIEVESAPDAGTTFKIYLK